MTPFFPTLVRAFAGGAAFETGKELARRNGLGFLQMEGSEDSGSDYVNFGFDYNYSDPWDYGFDFFSGGGWPDLNFDPYAYQSSTPGVTAGSPYELEAEYFYNQFMNPGAIDQGYGSAFLPDQSGSSGGSSWDSGAFWDWATSLLSSWVTPPFDGAPTYAQTVEATTGYPPCDGIWQGVMKNGVPTVECVPPPPPRGAQTRRPTPQQKAQQQAASAAKKAQQAKDKGCPKDPQGRPVFFNPTTGKCELVPPCAASGLKFDTRTRQCLTPQQVKDMYGEDNNWMIWALIALGVIVVAKSGGRKR